MQDLLNKITLGDSFPILQSLPDKCVDLILTDPPYGGFDNKARCRFDGGHLKNYDKQKAKEWDVSPSPEFFAEMFRVAKNVIIWGGNYFNLPPTRCFNVWRKPNFCENFTMAMCEYAWTSFDKNAKFWEFPSQIADRFHPTQKPLELFLRQLEEYSEPGMTVLDPFSGSGTTAIACHRLGRQFICIEKDPDYHARSCQRLAAELAQLKLPL